MHCIDDCGISTLGGPSKEEINNEKEGFQRVNTIYANLHKFRKDAPYDVELREALKSKFLRFWVPDCKEHLKRLQEPERNLEVERKPESKPEPDSVLISIHWPLSAHEGSMRYATIPKRDIGALHLTMDNATKETTVRQSPSSITFNFAKDLSLEFPVKHKFQEAGLPP